MTQADLGGINGSVTGGSCALTQSLPDEDIPFGAVSVLGRKNDGGKGEEPGCRECPGGHSYDHKFQVGPFAKEGRSYPDGNSGFHSPQTQASADDCHQWNCSTVPIPKNCLAIEKEKPKAACKSDSVCRHASLKHMGVGGFRGCHHGQKPPQRDK
jgi:hypothetical protein